MIRGPERRDLPDITGSVAVREQAGTPGVMAAPPVAGWAGWMDSSPGSRGPPMAASGGSRKARRVAECVSPAAGSVAIVCSRSAVAYRPAAMPASASATALTNCGSRGPHREAMSAFTTRMLPSRTAVTVSQPGRAATSAAL